MDAKSRAQAPERTVRLNVERLEGRDTPSAALGEAMSGSADPVLATGCLAGDPATVEPTAIAAVGGTSFYAEGYEYGDGTGMGWASGGYTAVSEGNTPATPAPAGVTQVYVNNKLVAVVEGKAEVSFLPPQTTDPNVGATVVFVNGQPVGTVTGTPAVATTAPAVATDVNGDTTETTGTIISITGTGDVAADFLSPDDLDLTLGLPYVG